MKTSKEALDNYRSVDDLWRSQRLPTAHDWYSLRQGQKVDFNVAKRAIHSLWRQELGETIYAKRIKTWKFRQGSGNRHTWVRSNKFTINCDSGWGEIIHGVSHLIDNYKYPNKRPHSPEHSALELRCTRFIIENNYIVKSDEALSKKADKSNLRVNKIAERWQRLLSRQSSWEKKLKLAETHLKKVNKEIRQYEQRHSLEKRTEKYVEPRVVNRKDVEYRTYKDRCEELNQQHPNKFLIEQCEVDGLIKVYDVINDAQDVELNMEFSPNQTRPWKKAYDYAIKEYSI